MTQSHDRHGLSRRAALALGGSTLAAILANPAAAAAVAATLEPVSLTLPSGQLVNGALARPREERAPAVLVIHEWWGLNDAIKTFTATLAEEGYLALAIDLMKGAVATTPEAAQKQLGAIVDAEAIETTKAWIAWLRAHQASTDRVATLGFCFGGGWSLNASLATPVEATVIYYGNVAKPASALAALKGPVLGHFATRDKFIDGAMVVNFAAAMREAGKELTIFRYDADHAFANPTSANYNAADARLSFARTLTFLKTTLA